jgi:pSer/pThr/pTyr-binding forkhead associated (FHA) protein
MGSELLILLLRLAIIVVLYAFLLAVLAVIRRDLRRAAAPATGRAPRDALLVLSPGDSSLVSGARLELARVTRIGRAPDNELQLDDQFVSAHHAVIERRDGTWWLTDKDSTNGTLVNGRPVTGSGRLHPDDVIRFGDLRLKLVRGESPE